MTSGLAMTSIIIATTDAAADGHAIIAFAKDTKPVCELNKCKL